MAKVLNKPQSSKINLRVLVMLWIKKKYLYLNNLISYLLVLSFSFSTIYFDSAAQLTYFNFKKINDYSIVGKFAGANRG